ncbi:MAG: hypothetical protein WBG36_02280 [Ornithinimicrobium sp.]
MSYLTKKFAVAAVGGATALALLGAPPASAGADDSDDSDERFQATARPMMTNNFAGPDGPTQFVDRVRLAFSIKADGERRGTVRLNRPEGVVTATFDLEPGASFPWHTHPGPVLVSVIGGGELNFVRARDCQPRQYPAGALFIEPGPVHTAYNKGPETVTVLGTFFDVEPGEALATPESEAKQVRLDRKCNIGTVVTPASGPTGGADASSRPM